MLATVRKTTSRIEKARSLLEDALDMAIRDDTTAQATTPTRV